MSVWTELRGTVKIPHHANFSVKKSFEEERWEGTFKVTSQLKTTDCHIEDIVFAISEDCHDASIMVIEWLDKFPKGSRVELEVKGRILYTAH